MKHLDLSKYTDDYIASAPSEQLNEERKELVRLTVALQSVTRKMRGRLASEEERRVAEREVERMSPDKRAAFMDVLKKATTSGSASVS